MVGWGSATSRSPWITPVLSLVLLFAGEESREGISITPKVNKESERNDCIPREKLCRVSAYVQMAAAKFATSWHRLAPLYF
jgi:hypothetical protein